MSVSPFYIFPNNIKDIKGINDVKKETKRDLEKWQKHFSGAQLIQNSDLYFV